MKTRSCLPGTAALLGLLMAAAVFADPLPGSPPAGAADPTFYLYEGVLNHLGTWVVAGDVVLCDSAICNSSTPISSWSDVVEFGPPNAQGWTETVTIYSDDDGTLNTWLSANTLSSNAFYLAEDSSGITLYEPSVDMKYYIYSPEGVPEPGSALLLLGGFGALWFGVRRRPA